MLSPVSSSTVVSLVPGSTGLMDPCQKGTVDATALLTVQERLDLTVSAQVSFGTHFLGGSRLAGSSWWVIVAFCN